MFGPDVTNRHFSSWFALIAGRFGLLCALLGAPLLVLAPARLSAQASAARVNGEVMVILAKAEAGEFDPKLTRMPALRKVPFDGYKSMKLLSTRDVQLSTTDAAITPLPKGRTLMLKLLGKTPDGRYRVQVSISKPGKRDYLPLMTVLASQAPFFVAGQHYQGGTLVIGIRLTP